MASSTSGNNQDISENGTDHDGVDDSRAMSNEPLTADQNAWSLFNTLCFDGGGIRGIFSLLVLKKLMECIKNEEARQSTGNGEQPVTSSFSLCDQPSSVSHIRIGQGEEQPQQYLPCHYFDLMCGTSTGGLIAIMLSRLRMPVKDCLEEYKRLGGFVFGAPRYVHGVGLLGFAGVSREKFDTEKLELAIRDVLHRRGEISTGSPSGMLFQTQRGLCRCFVIANYRQSMFHEGDRFILRSYQLRDATKDHGIRTKPLNAKHRASIAVWKVARATTAAPHYFKPLKIYLDDGDVIKEGDREVSGLDNGGVLKRRLRSASKHISFFKRNDIARPTELIAGDIQNIREYGQFTDGGFGGSVLPANNPSQEALEEIGFLKRKHQRVGTFVSIGTARGIPKTKIGQTIGDSARNAFDQASEVRGPHVHMVAAARAKQGMHEFDYFRLDSEDGLDGLEMDNWMPQNSGDTTIERIESAFEQWLAAEGTTTSLEQCAKKLVETRRKRSQDRSMWDRYAIGKYFVCSLENCTKDSDETWNYSKSFEHHLRSDHNITDETKVQDLLESCQVSGWTYKPPPTLA
ncbi:acyl transferase/acyl hydrolase/lysophospholipase [Bombardia bombarda]|uniref:Acyl transferase/acyl hydrolase/lysophospholipase n=1 Tax=Bombardia bombarda TaxID=252184 RepID=A0AA39XP01_9PEZI|nr:acyl transferase/acyl hydrolase/lysophospholipase [Bombardia bombarda]